MFLHCLAALVLLTTTPVAAGTSLIDPSMLPARVVHGSADLHALANDAKGNLSWGDGDVVDPAAEIVYPPGSILMLPAGQMHWLAARSDDLLLQLVVLDDEAPSPAVREQM